MRILNFRGAVGDKTSKLLGMTTEVCLIQYNMPTTIVIGPNKCQFRQNESTTIWVYEDLFDVYHLSLHF